MANKIYTKNDFEWDHKGYYITIYPPVGLWSPKEKLDQSYWDGFKGTEKQLTENKYAAFWAYIPFCTNRCKYCWFPTTTVKNESLRKDYNSLLKKDLLARSKTPNASKVEIKQFSFHGGTPTALPLDELLDLLEFCYKHFKIASDCITTMEVSVETVLRDKKKLQELKKFGIENLRMGVQSFAPQIKEIANQSHTIEDAKEAICFLKETGFNVDIDLLYGLAGQDFSVCEKDMKSVAEIKPDEVTVYQAFLKRPSTIWSDAVKQGNVVAGDYKFPTLEERMKMLDFAAEQLQSMGYIQDTVINFIMPGRARGERFYKAWWEHVMLDWDVIGVGPMTYSSMNGYGAVSAYTVRQYMDDARNSDLPFVAGRKDLPEDKISRYAIWGLHVGKIDKAEFQKRFGKDMHTVFPEQIEMFKQLGLVVEDENYIKPTRLGFFYVWNLSRYLYTKDVQKAFEHYTKQEYDDQGEALLRSFV